MIKGKAWDLKLCNLKSGQRCANFIQQFRDKVEQLQILIAMSILRLINFRYYESGVEKPLLLIFQSLSALINK